MKGLCHIVVIWLASFALHSHAATLMVVIPTPSILTAEFVSALRAERENDEIIVYSLADSVLPQARPDLIITMGTSSLKWQMTRADTTPTLATYVSRSGIRTAGLDLPPDHVRILLASPAPVRQLRLAGLLVPRLRTAALLHSPAHAGQVEAWSAAAEDTGVRLNIAELDSTEDLARSLVSVLDRGDVLLGLDDPQIYNADNLKTILLTSYTRDRVLIGPSAPFIAAGSLSTTFSSPAQTARSAGYLLDNPNAVSRVSYPRYFSVLSNQQVARSMGFAPPDDAALAAELARMEGAQ